MNKNQILNFIKKEQFAVISTVNVNGSPESALVAFSQTDDPFIILGTNVSTRKVDNLRTNKQVAIVFGFKPPISVQINGEAEILLNQEAEPYIKKHLKKYPQAIKYAHNPDQVWIRVKLLRMQHVDITTGQKQILELSKAQETLTIYTDGGSRGNPGPSAAGYVIASDGKILEEGGLYLGITTNNQAEYRAAKLALEKAAKYNPFEIEFHLDSELVVKQLNGEYKIKNSELKPVYEDILRLASQFQKVTFTHVRREFNQLADAQVNIILDKQAKSAV
jgi:ribonuclease HI